MSDLEKKSFYTERAHRYVQTKRDKGTRLSKKPPVSISKMPKTFLGVPCEKMTFSILSKEERAARRLEFEQGKRVEFVKFLAKTQTAALLAAGITKGQIQGMKNGFTPKGFNTHHKLPIFGGGTNDFSNLVLIRREPYHDMMHYHIINPQIRGMQEGDSKQVAIPNPKEYVYVPKPQYKFLEKRAKNGQKTYGKNKNMTLSQVYEEIKRNSMTVAGARKGR